MTDNRLLNNLNEAQKEAVTFGDGPVLILAGAGSGKTRALTYRAAYLIQEKMVAPDRIILVTFTNKAAKEMKERIKKIVGSVNLGFSGTFHSFGAKILRLNGEKIGIMKNFVIYDEGDSLTTIKQAMENMKTEAIYKPRVIKTLISQAKNELINHTEYSQYARGAIQLAAARVFPEYQRLLKQYGALDFDDLLTETVRLFIKDKDTLSQYQNQFLYVLVDEYQDTNKAQYVLTKLLAKKWRNLCAVGDFSQSIYSWRGADFRNLNRLEQDWPEIKIFNLEQNYRSTETILKAANQVISKNNNHPILKLWTNTKGGQKITVFGAEDEKEEVSLIIKAIKQSGENLNNWAVFYRTNAQSRVIEEGFIREGLAYVLIGGTKFYERAEIKDCLAYLKYFNNPKDAVSYKRIEKLGKKRLNDFLIWTEGAKKTTTKKILEQILKATKYLDKFDKKDEQDLMRLENIEELKSVAEEFKELNGFLENVALVEKTTKQQKEAVTLMTLHASKGLEFKYVFMIGMEEGLFPHSRSMMDREELEEERRLCYVGITRAREKLFFSFARRRLYFGSRNSNAVSRFLGDIDEKLMENDMINLDDY